ncbi:hypothetical protein BRC2024_KCUCJSVR_CDS_0021 [Acinetobacter phage vB_AbaM_KissB]
MIKSIGAQVREVNVQFFKGRRTNKFYLNVFFWCYAENFIRLRSVLCSLEANKRPYWV